MQQADSFNLMRTPFDHHLPASVRFFEPRPEVHLSLSASIEASCGVKYRFNWNLTGLVRKEFKYAEAAARKRCYMSQPSSNILKLELPTPYPVGNINAYFIDGAEPTLIDTGVYSSRSLNALREHLQAHGRRLEDIRRILITHDHFDHAGAALHLSEICRATLYLHDKSTALARTPPEAQQQLFNFLLRCGVPHNILEQAFALFNAGSRFAGLEAKPCAIEWLKGGETILCDNLVLTVMTTPGHSPDHLCYLDVGAGVLFCGDLLLPHITPNPLLYLDPKNDYRRSHSLLDYLDSLEKLQGRSLAIAYPGHGSAINDISGLISRYLNFIEQRKRKFLKNVVAGLNTPYKLALAVFGELDLANQYLAVSETVAYLDLLERREKISVDWDGDIIRCTEIII